MRTAKDTEWEVCVSALGDFMEHHDRELRDLQLANPEYDMGELIYALLDVGLNLRGSS